MNLLTWIIISLIILVLVFISVITFILKQGKRLYENIRNELRKDEQIIYRHDAEIKSIKKDIRDTQKPSNKKPSKNKNQ